MRRTRTRQNLDFSVVNVAILRVLSVCAHGAKHGVDSTAPLSGGRPE
ncbi:MAG: hypothetical protein ABI242_02620 [Caulobacteraceae bacterium]